MGQKNITTIEEVVRLFAWSSRSYIRRYTSYRDILYLWGVGNITYAPYIIDEPLIDLYIDFFQPRDLVSKSDPVRLVLKPCEDLPEWVQIAYTEGLLEHINL